jgi:hypothetical protein
MRWLRNGPQCSSFVSKWGLSITKSSDFARITVTLNLYRIRRKSKCWITSPSMKDSSRQYCANNDGIPFLALQSSRSPSLPTQSVRLWTSINHLLWWIHESCHLFTVGCVNANLVWINTSIQQQLKVTNNVMSFSRVKPWSTLRKIIFCFVSTAK